MVSFSILLKYDVPNCVFSTNSSDRFVFFMSSLLTMNTKLKMWNFFITLVIIYTSRQSNTLQHNAAQLHQVKHTNSSNIHVIRGKVPSFTKVWRITWHQTAINITGFCIQHSRIHFLPAYFTLFFWSVAPLPEWLVHPSQKLWINVKFRSLLQQFKCNTLYVVGFIAAYSYEFNSSVYSLSRVPSQRLTKWPCWSAIYRTRTTRSSKLPWWTCTNSPTSCGSSTSRWFHCWTSRSPRWGTLLMSSCCCFTRESTVCWAFTNLLVINPEKPPIPKHDSCHFKSDKGMI